MRYGFVDEAHRVMEGIVDAPARTSGTGCPSCSAGCRAAEFGVPGQLPDVVLTAGVGGGVAAAVPPLDAALRSRHPQGALHLAPAIPEWLGRFRLDGIPIMGGRLSLEVDGDRVESISVPDHLQIVPTPLYDEAGAR